MTTYTLLVSVIECEIDGSYSCHASAQWAVIDAEIGDVVFLCDEHEDTDADSFGSVSYTLDEWNAFYEAA